MIDTYPVTVALNFLDGVFDLLASPIGILFYGLAIVLLILNNIFYIINSAGREIKK